jgi:hypothetical protein
MEIPIVKHVEPPMRFDRKNYGQPKANYKLSCSSIFMVYAPLIRVHDDKIGRLSPNFVYFFAINEAI